MSLNEIVVLLVIAMIIFGPDDLPDIARALGKVVFEIRKIFNEMTKEFQDTVNAPKNIIQKTFDDTINPTPAKSTASKVEKKEGTSKTSEQEGKSSKDSTEDTAPEDTAPEEELLTYDDKDDDPLKELPEDMVSYEKSGVSR
ncbi:MAG: TatA [Desulfitobacterium sp.]|nr:TatA [Desulfitobacterium sp.]